MRITSTIRRWRSGLLVGLLAVGLAGCTPLNIFNPAFINQSTGTVFPLAPGDAAGFVLVRANNATDVDVEFLVTVERVTEFDAEGEIVAIGTESVRLFTPSDSRANDLGVLFDCPVLRVGLGEDLDRPTTEPGVFIGAEQIGVGGFGIPSNVNPLDIEAGNFDCGDTIVFQVLEASNVPGGVRVNAFVLDDESFAEGTPSINTFVNARSLVEEQTVSIVDEE